MLFSHAQGRAYRQSGVNQSASSLSSTAPAPRHVRCNGNNILGCLVVGHTLLRCCDLFGSRAGTILNSSVTKWCPCHKFSFNPIFQCNGGIGTDAMYLELYNRSTTKILIYGAGCSIVTEPTAQASHLWNLIQVM